MRTYQRIAFIVAITLAAAVVNCERAMATAAAKKTPLAELKKKADASDVAAMVELGKRHLFFDHAKDNVEEVMRWSRRPRGRHGTNRRHVWRCGEKVLVVAIARK